MYLAKPVPPARGDSPTDRNNLNLPTILSMASKSCRVYFKLAKSVVHNSIRQFIDEIGGISNVVLHIEIECGFDAVSVRCTEINRKGDNSDERPGAAPYRFPPFYGNRSEFSE